MELSPNQLLIQGIAIVKDNTMTALMQAADTFESFKVIGQRIKLKYSIADVNLEVNEALASNLYQVGMDTAKTEFGDKLVFCYIQKVSTKNNTYVNNSVVPICDNTISAISNGLNWFLISDWLKKDCKELIITEGQVRTIQSISFNKQ